MFAEIQGEEERVVLVDPRGMGSWLWNGTPHVGDLYSLISFGSRSCCGREPMNSTFHAVAVEFVWQFTNRRPS